LLVRALLVGSHFDPVRSGNSTRDGYRAVVLEELVKGLQPQQLSRRQYPGVVGKKDKAVALESGN